MNKIIQTYSDVVRKNIENYSGPFSELIKYAPDFYELFESMVKEKNLNENAKSIINSVVAYFVLPSDIIPEDEVGAFGYIDDLYLCVHAISKLNKDKKLISRYWKRDENIFKLAEEIKNQIEHASEELITPEELEEIKAYIEPKMRSYGMIQDQIPAHILIHFSKVAKENDLLTGKQRHLLYKLANMKMNGEKLSQKQYILLENILHRGKDEGLFKLECQDPECFKCKKMKELKIRSR